MIYRRLSNDNDDFTFGDGNNNFVNSVDAVSQAIKTRLQLLRGTFWRDVSDGFPLFQSILGSSGSVDNLDIISNIIQQRIGGTPNVTAISNLSTLFDPNTREYSFQATIDTAFGILVLQDILQ